MKKFLTLLVAVAITIPASALTLIDTAKPSKMIQTGVRIGLTSSNLTNNYEKAFDGMSWKNQNWGNGFLVGGIVDVNLLGCFSIEPGVFFYRKANTFNYLVNDGITLNAYEGRQYTNVFQLPVLLSFRIGIAEIVQVQVDAGPYFAWATGGKIKYNEFIQMPDGIDEHARTAPYLGNDGIAQRYDVGLKTGLGVLVMGHVYIGAHFSYGARNTLQAIYDTPVKGHSKVWQFTLGYNF